MRTEVKWWNFDNGVDKHQDRMKLDGLLKFYIRNIIRKEGEDVAFNLVKDFSKS